MAVGEILAQSLRWRLAGENCECPKEQLLRVKVYSRPEKRFLITDDFTVTRLSEGEGRMELLAENARFELKIHLAFDWTDETLRVAVDPFKLLELRASTFRLMELSVLPGLLATPAGEEVQWLVPAYIGCLVEPRRLKPVTCRNRFYMGQEEWEKFGVLDCFGIMTNRVSCLGIVESGAFYAWCDSEVGTERQRSYVTFGLRHDPGELLSPETKTVAYHFRAGRRTWSDLAFVYRDDLMGRRGIVPLRERIRHNPVLAYSARAMRFKLFLAVRPKMVPDGSSEMKVFTTFDEAGQIIQTLHDAGVREATFTLVGWNRGGHDGCYPTRFPVEERLGGEEALRRLIARTRELGFHIVVHDNVTDAYLQSPDLDYDALSRDEQGRRQVSGIWAGGESYKLCPTVYLERYGYNFQRIKDLGFHGSACLDAQTTGLFRCTHPDHPADERVFALSLCRMLSAARALYGAVWCEIGAAYVLPYADEVAHLHDEKTRRHFHDRLSAEFRALSAKVVPFYKVAVHGLILCDHGLDRGYDPLCVPWHELEYREGGYGRHYRERMPLILEHLKIRNQLPDQTLALATGYEEDGSTATVTFDNGVTLRQDLSTGEVVILHSVVKSEATR